MKVGVSVVLNIKQVLFMTLTFLAKIKDYNSI